MKKKHFFSILLFVLLLACTLVACNDNKITQKISFEEPSYTIVKGEKLKLQPILSSVSGAITWSSSEPTIATVSSDGEVCALSAGQITITAKIGSVSGTCSVVVVDNGYLPVIALNCDSVLTLINGSSFIIEADVKYNGNNITTPITYVSSDPSVATVSANGAISTLKVGATKITASVTYLGVTSKQDIALTVVGPYVISFKTAEGKIVNNAIEIIATSTQIISVECHKQEELITSTVTFSVENESVLTIASTDNSFTITPIKVGATRIKAEIVEEGFTYNSYLVVNTIRNSIDLNAENLIDLGSATGEAQDSKVSVTIPSALDVTKITEVLDITEKDSANISVVNKIASGNKIEIKTSGLAVGERKYKLITPLNQYFLNNVIVSTNVIKTAVDLDTFRNTYHTGNGAASRGVYITLGADIDYANNNFQLNGADLAYSTGTVFNGIFNGRGYTISNIDFYHGFLGGVRGTVKNLGLIATKTSTNGCGGITNWNEGVIDNCYVKITMPGTSARAAITSSNQKAGIIRNCIVDVEYTDKTAKLSAISHACIDSSTISNSYAISGTAISAYPNAPAEILFKTTTEFMERVASLPTENGWNSYWQYDAIGVSFGGKLVIDIVYSLNVTAPQYRLDFVKNTPIDFSMAEIATLSGSTISATDTITSLFLKNNSAAQQADLEMTKNTALDCVVSTDIATLTGGDNYTLTIELASRIKYKVNVTVADFAIKTAADLTTFGKEYYLPEQDNADGSFKGAHVILTADIDYGGKNYQTDVGYKYNGKWHGTLDGRGHTISNITFQQGLFGNVYVKGIVRNLGIDAIKADDRGGAICYGNYGIIENCFVKITVPKGVEAGGIARTNNDKTGKIRNCIAVVEFIDTPNKYNSITNDCIKDATVTNCYSISSTAKNAFNVGTVANKEGLFKTTADFMSGVTSLPTESGWNSYWQYSETGVSFGGSLVIDSKMYSLNATASAYKLDFDKTVNKTFSMENIALLSETTITDTDTIKSLLLKNNFGIDQLSLAMSKNNALDCVVSSDISALTGGENYTLTIELTSGIKYMLNATVSDKIINTATDLDTFRDTYHTGNGAASKGIYVTLGADIDYANKNFQGISTAKLYDPSTVFHGTFDGRGFTISNIDFFHGFLGGVRGTVKNLGLIARKTSTNGCGGIANWNEGVIENCYVKITMPGAASRAGITSSNQKAGIIRNCIVDVEYTDKTAKLSAISDVCKDTSKIINCYAISGTAIKAYPDAPSGILFKTYKEFMAGVESLPEEKGWNDYWLYATAGVSFGGNLVIDSNAYSLYTTAPNYRLDFDKSRNTPFSMAEIATLSGATITATDTIKSLYLKNNSVAEQSDLKMSKANALDCVVSTGISALTIGDENTLTIELTSGIKYIVNASVCDYVVRNAADLTTFGKEYYLEKEADGSAKRAYVVLATDIDYGGKNYQTEVGFAYNANWEGTLDGRGHTISNITFQQGLFGNVYTKGIVRNLGIITNKAGDVGGAICRRNFGIIENCFVKITVPETAEAAGIAWHNEDKTGKIRNCIVVVDFTAVPNKYNSITNDCISGATVTNCYSISSTAKNAFNVGTVAHPEGLFKTNAEFKTGVTSLPAENGWNSYWQYSATGVSFGGKLVVNI